MATPERFGVVEYLRDGLPVRVTMHAHGEPLEPRTGETVRWLVGDLSNYTAARLAAERGRQILRWCGETPDWLESYVPRLPCDYGRGRCRPVVSITGDNVTPYRSVLAASQASGVDRLVLRRRLADGRADSAGRLWRDATPN